MSLGAASVMAFLATTQPDRAKAFYTRTLGLMLVEDSEFALAFDVNGTALRIQKVDAFTPHPFTSLGWRVPDIAVSIATLEAKGAVFERYAWIGAEAPVWTSPSGARVAWFKDPDGNLLSLTEFA